MAKTLTNDPYNRGLLERRQSVTLKNVFIALKALAYLLDTSMPIKSSGRIVPPGWAPLQPKQSVLSLIV